ncbi:MAG: hypothetical protein A2X76_11820 [Lysobacterales bacterium GWF1_69_6]|nr:MAG: hypothetical protein A2X76_11820 [Xanthomonadales bacterium GWF1_69_6]
MSAGVFAYQEATKPPQYTGPAPAIPSPSPASAPAPAATVEPPPEAELKEIANAFEQDQENRIEAKLRALQAKHPESADLQALLARLEYAQAVAGRAQPIDKSRLNFDWPLMRSADQWAVRATETNPELAEAWRMRGRTALALGDPRQSLAYLERAEALQPDSALMRLHKGDTLQAMAAYTGDNVHLSKALVEYGRAIQPPPDSRLEYIALRQVGEIQAALGNHDEAIGALTRAIAGFEGSDLAFTLDARARINLDAGRVDAAISDSRAALKVMTFQVALHTLADALLVKAGLAVRNGKEALAAPYLEEFLSIEREPTEHADHLAEGKNTFPAVYALFSEPMRRGHWDRVVPDTLPGAAAFIGASDLRALASRGLRFDGGDQATSQLLFQAIAYDNVDAVRELLALGANTKVQREDGATLLDAARIGTRPDRAEIRRLLLARMGRPPGWTDTPVDLPTPGRWYRAERTIGAKENPNDKQIEAGMVLMAGTQCSTPGRPYTCFTFYTAPEKYYGTIKVPIDSPEDFNALREVEAPSP